MPVAESATLQGREHALRMLAERRANRPVPIDNASLWAGSPMTYYCKSCGHVSEVLPEAHRTTPKSLCGECLALRECGWLE